MLEKLPQFMIIFIVRCAGITPEKNIGIIHLPAGFLIINAQLHKQVIFRLIHRISFIGINYDNILLV